MSGSFDIRTVSVTNPESLYDLIEKDLKYDEFTGATPVVEDTDYGEEQLSYFMAGVTQTSLLNSALSEEEIGRLKNALDSGNIEYAVFPQDKHNGYIPIYLNPRTRGYIKNNVPGLVTGDKGIKWNIFKVPSDVDVDNNQLDGSHLVVEKIKAEDNTEIESPLKVEFSEIEDVLKDLAKVEEVEDYSSLDADIANKNAESVREKRELQEEIESHDPDEDNLELNTDASNFSSTRYQEASVEEDDEEVDTSKYGEAEDDGFWSNLESEITEEERAEALRNLEASEDAGDADEEASEGRDSIDMSEIDDNSKENTFDMDELEASIDETKDDVSSNEEADETHTYEPTVDTIRAEDYLEMPESLINSLKNIHITKFKYYEGSNLRPESREKINLFVDQLNEEIELEERNIKEMLVSEYRELMEVSRQNIDKELNSITGNEEIVEFRKDLSERKQYLEREATRKIEDNLKTLKDEFYGERFENFKNAWLAQAKEEFEEKHLSEFVTEPHAEYEDKINQKLETDKLEADSEYDSFIDDIESQARVDDKIKASKLLTAKIPSYVRDYDFKLASRRRDLDELINNVFKEDAVYEQNSQSQAHVNDLVSSHFATLTDAKTTKDLEDATREIEALKAKLSERDNLSESEKDALRKHYDEELRNIESSYDSRLKDIENNAIKIAEREPAEKASGKKRVASIITAIAVGGAVTLGGYFLGENAKETDIQNAFNSLPTEDVESIAPGEYEVGDMFVSEVNGVDVTYEVIDVDKDYIIVKNLGNGKESFVRIGDN